MGVLPLQYPQGESAQTLGLTGEETFEITGVEAMNDGAKPQTVKVRTSGGAEGAAEVEFDAVVRIDTPGELAYYRHGGIMPYVLRSIRNR